MRPPLLALLLLGGLSLSSLFAQQTPSKQRQPAYKLQRVRFVGSTRYSEEQLLSASGLKIGSDMSAQDLQKAASILSESGGFSEVRYRFDGGEAEYQVADNPDFVPCVFENLVWISDQDLLAAISRRLPLFNGKVPLNGNLAANVGKQIEGILKEKAIGATISWMPAATLNGPVNSIAFSAATPRVEISDIEFAGASPSQIPALQKATAPLLGSEYRQTMLQDFSKNSLRPIYMNQGYLHVQFSKALATPIATTPESAKVKITVPIEEGPVYHLKALNWPGSDILPAAATPKLYLLKPGDVVSQDLLRKSLNNVGATYVARGYMKATIRGTPTFDDAAHTVAYDIEVVPGDAYHLRNLEFKNLSDAQLQQVKQVWKLKPGDVYDPTYAPAFLVKNRPSLRALDGLSAIWTQKVDDEARAVDLLLTFRSGGLLK